MGKTKVTTRTLANGDKVRHHPNGTQVMVPRNRMADVVGQIADESEKHSAEMLEARKARVREKRDKQRAGRAVPADKSPI